MGGGGKVIANARGLRLTAALSQSLLGSVSDGGEGGGAEAELAHERLRSSQLEAELVEAQLGLQAAEAERARCSAEAAQAKAELAELKAKTE